MQIIILIQLTVCFESKIEGIQNRNCDSLLGDLEDRNYNVNQFSIEIGRGGYIDSHNANKFNPY